MFTSKIGSQTVTYHHSEEFHRLKQEIFTQHSYYVELDTATPTIIDAGAYIGLTTLYFKKLYPLAHIIALEPNPQMIPLLEENIWQNNLSDVDVHQVALSTHDGETQLYIDETDETWYSTASIHPGAWNGQQQTTSLTVPCRPLTDFLTQPIDVLKMDIEGAELEVLTAAQAQLHLVKHLLFEFHPREDQTLDQIKHLLELTNFAVELERDGIPLTDSELRRHPGRLLYVKARHK